MRGASAVLFHSGLLRVAGGTLMPPPPPIAPGTIFQPPHAPPPAMLPRGPPQYAPPFAPIFYWPYPSPPVSPTNYYSPGNVGGIPQIAQQATLVSL